MIIEAVIGANWGDEGKGLMTEYLCKNRPNPLVIMANGGCQRGHTVDDPKYGRHVFHHFCSGTFRGAPTFFPSRFLLNPMQFVKEYKELEQITGTAPVSFRSPSCVIQLPGDIALNWHIETCRGDRRHGSVGCGIWETVSRIRRPIAVDDKLRRKALTLDEFCKLSYNQQVDYIRNCAKETAEFRLAEEGITSPPRLFDLFLSDGFIDHFIADAIFMKEHCKSTPWIPNCETVIFECGQGLCLDEYYGAANEADTTPSMTGADGIVNTVNSICKAVTMKQPVPDHVESVTLNYVSRTYVTKHGPVKVGSFKAFTPDSSKFVDKTNIFNEWQGNLAIGELDCNALYRRIDRDVNMFNRFFAYNEIPVHKKILFTHLDEYDPGDIICDLRCSTGKADDVVCRI